MQIDHSGFRPKSLRAPRRWRFRALRGLGVVVAIPVAILLYATQPLFGLGPKPGSADTSPIDPQRLSAHVRELVATGNRDPRHPEILDAAAAYIRTELSRSGARMSEQAYTWNGRTYRNVIASLGPEAGERIVVGAHYDTCDGLPGADDNTSGVAGLIELAQALAKSALPTRVDLVAFTLEEPPYFATPHMGSAMHAASLKAAGVEVRAMVSLEMIGYFSDAPDSQTYPVSSMKWLYPSTGNFISLGGNVGGGNLVRHFKQAMSAAGDLPVYSLNAPSDMFGMGLSDQRNYWAQGYPALMVSDTAFFRNGQYHQAGDTPERLDYERMAKVVRGVEAAVRDLAR